LPGGSFSADEQQKAAGAFRIASAQGEFSRMKPLTEQHLAILRRHMVEMIGIHFDLAGEEIGKVEPEARLRDALLRVPRHLFVPSQLAIAAYQDTPLPIGFDKTVSQPFIGALMIDLLAVEPGQRVLEVGTGLGYQAAVLAELGARLWTVEIVEEFASEAGLRLSTLGYEGISLRVGDGSRGWGEHAPFDRILVTAAAKEPPAALLGQLAPGGRMVIPLGPKEVQQLSVVEKRADGSASVREVMAVRFTQLETAA
jgi:protein-L-isoaspartate(D-aspartate) O-methyltransferase